jgi:hypothetical protein
VFPGGTRQFGRSPPLADVTDSVFPRTLILTDEHLVLAVEDHVSYPLPDFARVLPDQHYQIQNGIHTEIVEVRYLEYLVRVELSDANPSQTKLI